MHWYAGTWKEDILACFKVLCSIHLEVDCVWNVMAHAQKPDFVFRRNGRFHLNRRGRQFSGLLAAEMCASAVVIVVMLDTRCSEVVWSVHTTHSTRQFPLHFPSRASPYAITFQLDSTEEGEKLILEETVLARDSECLTCWTRSRCVNHYSSERYMH
jgi:hypothetical protein